MYHSLQEYMERQSTEKLEKFLEDYYKGNFTEDYSYAIPYVESELNRRKVD